MSSEYFSLGKDFLCLRNAATAPSPSGRRIVLHLEPFDPNRPRHHKKAIQLLLDASQAERLADLLRDAAREAREARRPGLPPGAN